MSVSVCVCPCSSYMIKALYCSHSHPYFIGAIGSGTGIFWNWVYCNNYAINYYLYTYVCTHPYHLQCRYQQYIIIIGMYIMAMNLYFSLSKGMAPQC